MVKITFTMVKITFTMVMIFVLLHDASVLHDLCSKHDKDFCTTFTKTELDQLIIDISLN